MTTNQKYNIIRYAKMRSLEKVLIITISSFLFACTNSQNVKLNYTEADTVKNTVKERESDVTWTKEMEPNRLDIDISKNSRLANDVFNEPGNVRVIKNYQQKVYPYLEDFGSLNNSNFTKEQNEKVNGFCSAIAENIYEKPEAFFKQSYIFNLVFFQNELIEKWPLYFEKDFPVKPEDFKTETSEENKEVVTPEPIFTHWLCGEPFIGETLIEFPVRFFSKNGTVDVTILMSKKDNSIYQISINRWERGHGR